MLEYLILGVLLDGSYTGYDIKALISRNLKMFCKISFGSLYPALRRLENKQMVISKNENKGDRKRIIYSITNLGKDKFMFWLKGPVVISENMDVNLAKVYFLDKIDYSEAKEIINELLLGYKKTTSYLISYKEKLLAKKSSDTYYKLSTIYYGIGVCNEIIRWCEAIKERNDLEEYINKDM